jgi:hypothetical protein
VVVSVIGLGLVVMVGFSIVALYLYWRQKRRYRLLNKIPEMFAKNANFSLQDILRDRSIRHIRYSDIRLGDRIGVGGSGEVVRAVWKGKFVSGCLLPIVIFSRICLVYLMLWLWDAFRLL